MLLELEVRENVTTRRGAPTSVSWTDDDRMGVPKSPYVPESILRGRDLAGRVKAIWSFRVNHDLESRGVGCRDPGLIPIDVQTPEAHLRENPGTRELLHSIVSDIAAVEATGDVSRGSLHPPSRSVPREARQGVSVILHQPSTTWRYRSPDNNVKVAVLAVSLTKVREEDLKSDHRETGTETDCAGPVPLI
jgi:hypothetical protein